MHKEIGRVPSVKYVLSRKMHGIVLMLNKRVRMRGTNLHFQDGNDNTYPGGYLNKIGIIGSFIHIFRIY